MAYTTNSSTQQSNGRAYPVSVVIGYRYQPQPPQLYHAVLGLFLFVNDVNDLPCALNSTSLRSADDVRLVADIIYQHEQQSPCPLVFRFRSVVRLPSVQFLRDGNIKPRERLLMLSGYFGLTHKQRFRDSTCRRCKVTVS